MADTNTIGDPSDYTVFVGDDAAGSAEYGWYMKPEDIQLSYGTPETLKQLIEMDKNYCVQMGKQIAVFTLRNVIINVQGAVTAFTELEKLKKAIMYWATGNTGATYGGYLLYFVAKDVNGNEWSKLGSWATPETLASMRTKIINPLIILPQPNGDYLIRELKIMNFKSLEDLS